MKNRDEIIEIPFEQIVRELQVHMNRVIADTVKKYATVVDEDGDPACAVLADVIYRAASKLSIATCPEMEAVMLAGLRPEQTPPEVIEMLAEREMDRCTHNTGRVFKSLFDVEIVSRTIRGDDARRMMAEAEDDDEPSEHNAKVAEEIMAELKAAGEVH